MRPDSPLFFRMSKRLSENLNSQYIGAASRMKPAGSRRRIIVYVEGFDDIMFWRNVLGRFENDRIYFEIMLPSRTSLAKGKKIAITNILHNSLGKNMIACVDADYDYLLQGSRESSRAMCCNPYVFHTYAYAIENFQCYAPSLRNVCVIATLNDRKIFDFEQYMREFSETVYPLFVWSIWCYRTGNFKHFSLSSLCSVISLREVNIYHPERAIELLRQRVNRAMSWLQRRFPQAKKEYAPLRDELSRLGVTPDNVYMYIRGHDIFDAVICPLITSVCDTLRRERESEIRRLAVNIQQMQNELSGYQHSISPPDFALRKHTDFTEAPQYQQILDSLRDFLSDFSEPLDENKETGANGNTGGQ